jgi:uncharacterized protein (TIGR02594 family)
MRPSLVLRSALAAALGASLAAAPALARGGLAAAPDAALAAPADAGAGALIEAARWLGRANPTGTAGPWCADFVSFVLKRVGLPPLSGRMAADALGYGPRLPRPRVGALAVMRTRRAAFGHVGFVEAIEADGSIELLSGNVRNRVARAREPAAAFVAFVDVGSAAAHPAGEVVHPRAGRRAKAKVARFRRAVKRA